MKVQRFRARSYTDALRQVRDALGEDAVILESRRVRSPSTADATTRRQWKWLNLGKEGAEESEGDPGVVEVEITAAIGDGADALVSSASEPEHTLPSAQSPTPPSTVRAVVERAHPPGSEAIRGLEVRLRSEEVDPDLIHDLLQLVARRARPTELEVPERMLDLLVSELMSRVRLATLPPPSGAMGPRVLVLVGPSGSGKTTTAAKIAASAALGRRERVALLALIEKGGDKDGVLERTSRVLRCPLHVASDEAELMEALEPLSNVDLIIIDTPPINPLDPDGVAALAGLLTVVPRRGVHLVLSPTLRDRDLIAAADCFRPLGLDGLIFCRLDEATSYGGMLNLCAASGLPLSWFCFGPKVPADIEPASAERLVDLLLDLSGGAGEAP